MAIPPSRSHRARRGAVPASDAAYRPRASTLPAAWTTPTRICCSCCSAQSVAPGQRGGRRRSQPQRGQQPGLVLLAAGEIQDAGRQPGPDGGLSQHRVQRVAEPHAVQRVADFGGPDQPGDPLPGGDHRVENGGLLETVYQQHAGARCPARGALNGPARLPGPGADSAHQRRAVGGHHGGREDTMAVTTFHDLPLADRDRRWDGGAAEKRVRKWAGAQDEPNEKYRDAHLWYDPENSRPSGPVP